MLKIFLILLLISTISAYVAPGENTIGNFSDENQRIASGVAAKKGENVDFCYLTINFLQKKQNCGCFIYNKNYVGTSARCVVE